MAMLTEPKTVEIEPYWTGAALDVADAASAPLERVAEADA